MDMQLKSLINLLLFTCASFSLLGFIAGDLDDEVRDDLTIDGGNCEFSVSEHYSLYGHNDQSLGSRSLQQCLDYCGFSEECLSVTRNVENGNCFISHSSKTTDPDDYRPHVKKNYYHKESCEEIEENSADKPCIQSFGPFGGLGGTAFSDEEIFMKDYGNISKIHIHHGYSIDCIRFTYGRKDQAINGLCHGGEGGTLDVIRLKKHERITRVEGMTGLVIDKLKIVTNLQTYGPYGIEGDEEFEATATGRGLAYISGRSGNLLDQLYFHFYC